MQVDVEIVAAVITTIVTIVGSMYGILKFMLKDTHREVEILSKGHEQLSNELKLTNHRMDGLYRVLLDRTYGTNIPAALKQEAK